MKQVCLLLLVAGLGAPTLAAADFYRYETDSGVLSFTDDLKHVPTRYREDVKIEEERALVDYARLTIAESAAMTPEPSKASEATPSGDVPAVATKLPASRMWISSNPNETRFELAANTDQPVFIERKVEWRWSDNVYVPFQIVKKDGKVVSVTQLR